MVYTIDGRSSSCGLDWNSIHLSILYSMSSPPLGSLPRLPRLPKLPLLRLLPLLSFLISIRVEILLPAKLLALVTAGIDGRSEPLESTLLHGLSFWLHTYDESSDVPLFCRLPGCNGPLSTRRLEYEKDRQDIMIKMIKSPVILFHENSPKNILCSCKNYQIFLVIFYILVLNLEYIDCNLMTI